MNKMDLEKCRICLQVKRNGSLKSLFDRLENDSVISNNIITIANINIDPTDRLPKTICNKCVKRLKNCIQFIELCQVSDFTLRKLNSPKKFDESELIEEIKKEKGKECIEEVNLNVSEDKKYENDNLNNEKYPSSIKTSQHQCFTCGKVMSSRYRLKTHLVTHTKERPHSCEQCGKKFSLIETLNVHKRIHTGEKPFHCPTCGEEFAHSAGLIAHKRKHTGQLPYQCHLCPKRFRTIGHLQYHVCKHTGKTNFDCDTCGRGFITRQDLKQHLMTHVGDKPHVCCVCGLRLSRASNLKRHFKVAHGDEDSIKINSKSTRNGKNPVKYNDMSVNEINIMNSTK